MEEENVIELYDEELDLDDLQGIAGGTGGADKSWNLVQAIRNSVLVNDPFSSNPTVLGKVEAGWKFWVKGTLNDPAYLKNGMVNAFSARYTNCWINAADLEDIPDGI